MRERGTSFSDLVVNILKGHQMLTILGEEQYKDYKGMVILRQFSRIFFMQCLGTGDKINDPLLDPVNLSIPKMCIKRHLN